MLRSLYTAKFPVGKTVVHVSVNSVLQGTYTWKLEDASGNVVDGQTGTVAVN